jgi:hypothetical protein
LKADIWRVLKVIQSIPGMPRQVTEAEINDFLENKPNIQISTIDPEGYPYNSALMGSFTKDYQARYIWYSKNEKKGSEYSNKS